MRNVRDINPIGLVVKCVRDKKWIKWNANHEDVPIEKCPGACQK